MKVIGNTRVWEGWQIINAGLELKSAIPQWEFVELHAFEEALAELKAKNMECESLKNAKDDRTEALFEARSLQSKLARAITLLSEMEERLLKQGYYPERYVAMLNNWLYEVSELKKDQGDV